MVVFVVVVVEVVVVVIMVVVVFVVIVVVLVMRRASSLWSCVAVVVVGVVVAVLVIVEVVVVVVVAASCGTMCSVSDTWRSPAIIGHRRQQDNAVITNTTDTRQQPSLFREPRACRAGKQRSEAGHPPNGLGCYVGHFDSRMGSNAAGWALKWRRMGSNAAGWALMVCRMDSV